MADVITPDGSVYRFDDGAGVWRHIPDVDTANALGVDWNGLEQVDAPPGATGEDWPSVNGGGGGGGGGGGQPQLGGQPELVGLPDGSVFLLDNGVYRHIPDPATLTAIGFQWSQITWQDGLPGPAGAEVPAITAPPPASPPPSVIGADDDSVGMLTEDEVLYSIMSEYSADVNIGLARLPAAAWSDVRALLVHDLPFVGSHVRSRGAAMRAPRPDDLAP